MPEVILRLSDATYERFANAAAAVHKPLEVWMVDILTSALEQTSSTMDSHNMLVATLDALGFERLALDQTKRLSLLLRSRKTRPLSCDEATELRALLEAANALELASLQRLTTTLHR